MRTYYILQTLVTLFFAFTATAQQGINYKAIINDDNGVALANTSVTVQFTILENGTTNVFQETHNPTTDDNGIIIVNIGEGTVISGDFNTIDWGSNPHFLITEIDTGDGLTDMGTTEFKAVPYALYSETANVAIIDNVDGAESGDILQYDGNSFKPVSFKFYYKDNDEDGYGDEDLFVYAPSTPPGFINNSDDCDDTDADINPGATELHDNIDNNCNGIIDEGFTECTDSDGDGYGDGPGCLGLDCDDDNPEVYPDAQEACDGLDNNCNGEIDENGVWLGIMCDGTDTDLCEEGVFECNDGVLECNDYSDDNPEFCDGIDNDCDMQTDEDCVVEDCFITVVTLFGCIEENCSGNLDPSCFDQFCEVEYERAGQCLDVNCVSGFIINPELLPFDETWTNEMKAEFMIEQCGLVDEDGDGYNQIDGDCDDSDASIHPGASEICDDGIDQDCNGSDAICGDNDGDGFTVELGDCDDDNPEVFPGAQEQCNGIDDNCDGEVDNVTSEEYTWYEDADADTYGNSGVITIACSPPPGYVGNGDDCDDTNASIHPGAEEICEDGIDNDCDIDIDENCSTSCADQGDCDPGYYCENNTCVPQKPIGDPCLEGYECTSEYCFDGYCYEYIDSDADGYTVEEGDCNDNDATIYPGAPEILDAKDNNCNGIVDEGLIPGGAVIVTEIMHNPSVVTDQAGEWFEVTNVWSNTVNLHSFSIQDNFIDDHIINNPSGIVLIPGETAVFCANDDPSLNGGVSCDYEWNNFQLANTGDEIILIHGGIEIDRVNYAGAATWPNQAGRSMSLDPLYYDAASNQDGANWCATPTDPAYMISGGDYGTPGEINPSCSGTAVIVSVTPNSGTEAGGQTVMITGSGFIGTSAVRIGTVDCSSFTLVDDSHISCVTPAQSSGDYDVVVIKGGDTEILVNGYRYTTVASGSSILWSALQFPQTMSAFAGTSTSSIFGRIFIEDVTADPGPPPGIIAEVGVGPQGSDPSTSPDWLWYSADWNPGCDPCGSGDDEFMGHFIVSEAGTYSYTYRFSDDGGYSFVYTDFQPGTSDGFSIADLGTLTVQAAQ